MVLKNRWAILAHLVPDALIADRSAASDGDAAPANRPADAVSTPLRCPVP
jgi:hypothetical protein